MSKIKTNKQKSRFVLPTADSEPRTSLQDYTFLIFGPPKTGKTTLAIEMKGDDRPNLLIAAEDGAKALRCRPAPVRKFGDAGKWVDLLDESREYGGAIVDTAEALYRHSVRATCKRLDIEHLADADWGAGWDGARIPYVDLLQRLLSMPDKGAVLLSHAVYGKRKTKDGDEIEDIHPNLPGRILEEVTGMVDVIGFIYRTKGQNWLRIVGSDEITAGCRLEENFRYSDGSRVEVIPMGRSAREGWEQLQAAFNNELDPPPPEERKKVKLKSKKAKR